jgi:hypothetical protein
MTVEVDGKSEVEEFEQHDQFAPELTYFSDCIINNTEPEPSGVEGLADMRVIEALHEAAAQRQSIRPGALPEEPRHPGPEQIQVFPAVPKPDIVNAKSGSQ